MNQFPYIVAPWDHWNKVMDVLKSRDENEGDKIEEHNFLLKLFDKAEIINVNNI